MAKGAMVELQAPQGSTSGYVMGMVHGRGRPGLVVLHDAWGLTPHIRDVVNRFAHEGYDALALDLLQGRVAATADEAALQIADFNRDRAIADIGTALDYLCEADHRAHAGIVGFGLGGELAIEAARHARVASYISFYGFPPTAERLTSIRAQGMLHCGDQDATYPMARAVAFVQQQASSGVLTEMAVYPHAGYAFFNDARPDAYQPVPARTAWSRTIAQFNRQVRGGASGAA